MKSRPATAVDNEIVHLCARVSSNLILEPDFEFQGSKITALEFNECITRHDIGGLSALMSEDHLFVDREDKTEISRQKMTRGWAEFFKLFPDYKNTFVRVESRDDIVIMIGYAYWDETNSHDSAIWVAKIKDDLVAEWRIFYDEAENRRRFGID